MEMIACPLFKCMNDPYQWPFISYIHRKRERKRASEGETFWFPFFKSSIKSFQNEIISYREEDTSKRTFFKKGSWRKREGRQNRDNANYHYTTVNIMTYSGIVLSFQCKNRFFADFKWFSNVQYHHHHQSAKVKSENEQNQFHFWWYETIRCERSFWKTP